MRSPWAIPNDPRIAEAQAQVTGRVELEARWCVCGLEAGRRGPVPSERPPSVRTVEDGLSICRCEGCGGLRKE